MATSRLSPRLILIRRVLSPVLGKKVFQGIFELLYLFSLSGMNYGWTTPKKSGEKFAIYYIAGKLSTSQKLVIFDVGANKGDYTQEIINSIKNRKVTIYSFEPLPNAFSILQNRFLKNKSVHPYALALGDKKAKAPIYFDTPTSELGTLYPDQLKGVEQVRKSHKETIPLTTLDLFCKRNLIKHIHFLKIDTEGHELKVLKGAKNMIKQNNIDYIQFEFGGTMIHSKTFFSEIFSFLHEKYMIYRILQDGLWPITVCNETTEVFVTSNYLAVRK